MEWDKLKSIRDEIINVLKAHKITVGEMGAVMGMVNVITMSIIREVSERVENNENG